MSAAPRTPAYPDPSDGGVKTRVGAGAPRRHGRRGAAAAGEPAIHALELAKRFGDVVAVDGVTLCVRAGEVYGFLGRNGAGKTTTIRMLLGLARPTRGRVLLLGRDVASERRAALRPVGSLVERASAYGNLTARENLEVQRRLTGAPRGAGERAAEEVGLTPWLDRRASQLSLGNRQRLGLARALLTRPRLLVLDEPSNGLDPAGVVEVRRLLRRLADEEGTCVFVSSHALGEIAQLADRIGILHRGRLVEEVDLRGAAGGGNGVALEVSDGARAAAVLAGLPGVGEVRAVGATGLHVLGGEVPSAGLVRALVTAGVDVSGAAPLREDLEARFLRRTAEDADRRPDAAEPDGGSAVAPRAGGAA